VHESGGGGVRAYADSAAKVRESGRAVERGGAIECPCTGNGVKNPYASA
jgi:hypothetical protein